MEWEVKRDGRVIAHGPMSTMLSEDKIRDLIAAGYKVYVDGKIYKKPNNKIGGE